MARTSDGHLAHWRLFARTAIACWAVTLALLGFCLRKIDSPPIDQRPLTFDGNRAHQDMTKLSKDFPYRLPWHVNRERAGSWIQQRFQEMGYAPKTMPFSEVIAGKNYTNLRNIYAEKPGTTKAKETVIVAAHYDTAETTVEGAMDDASGVSVVLELARIFKSLPTQRTIVFLTTDSEEFGAFWGAHSFVKQYDRIQDVIAVANFDFVSADEQSTILSLNDGLNSGYTPLWLRELSLNALRSVAQSPDGGFEAKDLTGFLEIIQRAILIPAADHGAFLQAGVPAFNWVGQTKTFAHQMAHYHHTPLDRAEIIQPRSLNQYGRAAERFLYSIDAIPTVPDGFRQSTDFKVSSTLYIPGLWIRIMQALLFFPFLLFAFFKLFTLLAEYPVKKWRKVFRSELAVMGVMLTAFLSGFALMKLLPSLDLIESYENFPATQKSSLLYNPNFWTIGLVLAVVWIVYKVLTRIVGIRHDVDPDTSSIRHTLHSLILALVICAAFVRNAYLAVLLLLPPAYLWPAIWTRKHVPGKVLNFLLMLGGAITLVVIALVMTTIFHVGAAYWYLFLGATYGLVSAYSVVLFFIAISIMIRLFRSFVMRV